MNTLGNECAGRATWSAADQTEASSCNLCGSGDRQVWYGATTSRPPAPGEFACTSPYLGLHTDIYRCPACQLVYAQPDVSDDEIVARYQEVEDPTYLVEDAARERAFADLLDRLEYYHPRRGKLLEIGSAVGLFLKVAAARGWEVIGVEPSAWAVTYGREHYGVDLRQGVLADAPDGPFDAIVLWDVLEHLPDPKVALIQLHRRLEPGGILGLTTVNVRSMHARLMGTRWPWFMSMHLYYFTPQTLRRYLEETGYEILSLATMGRTFRLDYLCERAGRAFRPLTLVRWLARYCGLANLPVHVDLGDILVSMATRTTVTAENKQ